MQVQAKEQPPTESLTHKGSSKRLRTFIARIPKRYIVTLGRVLGTLTYALDFRHRRIVRRNLRFAHPGWSRDRIRELTKRVFQNAGITVLEVCQMASFSREDVLQNVRLKGKENLLNAVKSTKGAIMITAHLGNWEMAAIFVCCFLQKPVVAVAKKLRSKILEAWTFNLRTRFGNVILDKKRALPKMVRTLQQGKMLGILIDQNTTMGEGIEVTFFGKTTNATPAAAILARRYDSQVVPAFCIREPDGGLTLIVGTPLRLKKTDDSRADLQTNTQLMTDAIEDAIKAYPEQWFWFHKRWKRHHPSLYPEDIARRRRRREKKKRLKMA